MLEPDCPTVLPSVKIGPRRREEEQGGVLGVVSFRLAEAAVDTLKM